MQVGTYPTRNFATLGPVSYTHLRREDANTLALSTTVRCLRRFIAYSKVREHAPKGADWDKAVSHWKTLKSDDAAVFDKDCLLYTSVKL